MLKRADFPEQLGIDSNKIIDLINYYKDIKMRADNFMVIRDGVVATEFHYSPNSANTPHAMYSLSKTITSTAIGIAWDEGIIDLDTKIFVKYFPDKLARLSGQQKEWAEKMTIHDVISMRAGKATGVLENKEKNNWLDAILDVKTVFEPGTDWKYVSENAYVLSYILQLETGMTMTEYLTPRLYEPLGMEVPHWEKSQQGVDAGGWGLKLTAEDLAKISILYVNKGEYFGKRIFSEEWFNKAVTPYTQKTYPIFTSNTQYGYQIWIDHENNDTTYRFTGLYGQFIFMYPEYNTGIVLMASDNRDYELIHSIYDRFPDAFVEKTDVAPKSADELKAIAASLKVDPKLKNAVQRNSEIEKRINNRNIKLVPMANLSTQGASTYFMWRKKIGHMNDIKFVFNKTYFEFSFKEKDSERATIKVGLNGEFIHNELILGENPCSIDAVGAWNKDGSLEMFLYNTGNPQTKRFKFKFGKKMVSVLTKVDPGYADIAKFNIEFNNGFEVKGPLLKGIQIGAPLFELFYADPNTVGYFED